MSSVSESLFRIKGEVSEEGLAALTAVLMARVAARESAVVPAGSECRKVRWRHDYRSPVSWR